MSATEHHVGMKFTKHPDGRTEVEVHQMPLPPMQNNNSGMAPQGMVPDPMAAGAKGAMDAVLPSPAAETPNAGVDKRQNERMGSEQGRPAAKKPEKAVGKPAPVAEKAKTPKPDGKNAKKSSEKDKGRAP